MLQSLFILNPTGEIIIEKHWRGLVNRAICETFWQEVARADSHEEVLPVITTPKYYLVHILRNGLFFLGTVQSEVDPLLVIEFLDRVYSIFADYFQDVTEDSIKDNFVTVYQLLDEMMDNGIPMTTEPNVLKAMIQPQGMLSRMVSHVTGGGGGGTMSEELPDGSLSSVPWRKSGVKYTSNECYLDIIEEIDAIVDSNGILLSVEVNGEIQVQCKLGGMPDLTLYFQNPGILDDCSFHPCVRLSRFERERTVSFIPPDGNFKLMTYRINQSIQLPVYVKPQITYRGQSGRIEVMVGQRNTHGKTVEDIVVTIPFPKCVSAPNLTTNVGVVQFDEVTKVCKWDVGKIPKDKSPSLSGSIALATNTPAPEDSPVVELAFKIASFSVSGLKVDRLDLVNEKYRVYKGVRSVTRAGRFQVRT